MTRGFRVYLAGKMGGRMGYEVLAERRRAVKACEGFDLLPIDPAEGELIDPATRVDIKMDFITMQRFVAKDEYAIRTSNALLVLTGDTPSEGTGLEFGLALELGIPVVVISPKRVQGALMGFWNVKASAIFDNVEAAVEFIAIHYGGVTMPFTTPEARRMTDAVGPKEVGDRCFLAYREMVHRWNASPRWTTAHEIYRDLVLTPRLQDAISDPMYCRTMDETTATELAWQVFFIEKVMPYEMEKKALNGDIE